MLKDKTSRTRRTDDLISLCKHLDKDFDWAFCIVYDKNTNEKLGMYFNYPNNKTRPLTPQEL